MGKAITSFLFLFIGCAILSAIMQGGGGIASTPLTQVVGTADDHLHVKSTTGFLTQDYIIIGSEKILYTGKTATTFTGCTRGYNSTSIKSHASGAMVYTADASTINNALGFNVAAMTDSMGIWVAVTIPFNFLTKTIPRGIVMNYNFLVGDLSIISLFFFASFAGLIISIAIALAGGRRMS